MIPFNSIDKDFQFIPQPRASVEEIRKRDSTSHNIIPIPYSLPIPVPKLNMVPISVPIINTALNNSTILRTDTFPYGTTPSFFAQFPIEICVVTRVPRTVRFLLKFLFQFLLSIRYLTIPQQYLPIRFRTVQPLVFLRNSRSKFA